MDIQIKKIYTKSSIVYYSIFALAFAAYYFGKQMANNGLIVDSEQHKTFVSSIIYMYLLLSIPLGLKYFSVQVKKMLEKSEEQRLKQYSNLLLLRIVLIGLNFVVNPFLLFVFNDKSFIYAAGIGALALFFCKPNRDKIKEDIYPETEINTEL